MTRWPFRFTACPLLHQVSGLNRLHRHCDDGRPRRPARARWSDQREQPACFVRSLQQRPRRRAPLEDTDGRVATAAAEAAWVTGPAIHPQAVTAVMAVSRRRQLHRDIPRTRLDGGVGLSRLGYPAVVFVGTTQRT